MLADSVERVAPIHWQALADAHDNEELTDCAQRLQSLALMTTRAAAYFNARVIGINHTGSVKAANRAVKASAKTLGLTYPETHLFTF